MIIEQRKWTSGAGWVTVRSAAFPGQPQVVFCFAAKQLLEQPEHFAAIREIYPQSHIIAASTAGEILGTLVDDDSIVLTAIYFEKTSLQFASLAVSANANSYQLGTQLASQLSPEGLRHVMVMSDGLQVHATPLLQGISETLPAHVAVTGGLAGDGTRFQHTLVGLDGQPVEGQVVAVGFYGQEIHIGYGSYGGWDTFGPERRLTKSQGNILYEIDGQPALALYKKYLGERAKDLPYSGLLFPISLQLRDSKGEPTEVVRTLLAVDEATQSITFAGDVPEGVYAKLMRANFERLIDGAGTAASASLQGLGQSQPALALLISCVGRKEVLKERTEEELEAAQEVLGPQAAMAGFYSYGEISPTSPDEKQGQLHNETMTITTFREE